MSNDLMPMFTGWPHSTMTKSEAQAIVAIFHELNLHDIKLSTDRFWYLAGQIVGRMKRDNIDIFERNAVVHTKDYTYEIGERIRIRGKHWTVVQYKNGVAGLEDHEWKSELLANRAKTVYEHNSNWFGVGAFDVMTEFNRLNPETLTYLKS